jgi:siroheme synthase-like protein
LAHRYPILLDVADRRVLIVGGGTVAARKAAGLLAAGATNLRVVALTLADDFPEGVDRVVKPYDPADLDGVDLAFAATDSAAVNDAVVADAQARRIWVSHAGDGPAGDFVTPARFDRGPVTVTVSAGSAALAVLVRDGLARRFDPAWAAMAEAMATLRPLVRDGSGLDEPDRRAVLRDLATDAACGVLGERGLDGLKQWLRERHPNIPVLPGQAGV